jgi:hypothetical protein
MSHADQGGIMNRAQMGLFGKKPSGAAAQAVAQFVRSYGLSVAIGIGIAAGIAAYVRLKNGRRGFQGRSTERTHGFENVDAYHTNDMQPPFDEAPVTTGGNQDYE